MASTIINDNYNIYINQQTDLLTTYINENAFSKVFVLVDQNTEQYCLPLILEALPESSVIIHVEDGENNKNLKTAEFIWNALLNNGCDRQSLMINLGGGVIGDIGGFCASTFMRGIAFINIPTTLLAQVDASIGSKSGLDLNDVKNIIGTFSHPKAVIIYTSFLKSLSYKEILSGYAEIIKHSLIADTDLWEKIKTNHEIIAEDFEYFIASNISIKNKVVTADPLEKGERKILNFGHTLGHAIETLLIQTNDSLLHGEAIAIGMVCESYLSYKKNYISLDECSEIKNLILSLYGNKYKSLPAFEKIYNVMKFDKKNHKGQIHFSLLEKIGKANFNQLCSEDEIKESLEWYRK